MPRRQEPARLVEGGRDEPAVDEAWARLVTGVERDRRLVLGDALGLRQRKSEPGGVLAAAPARRIVVWRDAESLRRMVRVSQGEVLS
ncbi:MAG: hypothetical protein M3303_01280 [Gemmatimonadota bacterium]|nr:hypothetical protein [Gemmatimonadota bacterium]